MECVDLRLSARIMSASLAGRHRPGPVQGLRSFLHNMLSGYLMSSLRQPVYSVSGRRHLRQWELGWGLSNGTNTISDRKLGHFSGFKVF